MNFLADENLSRRFVNALRRQLTVDVVRVQDVGLLGKEDTAVLDWAVENNRVLITKDRATITPLVAERMAIGESTPRILIIRPGAYLPETISIMQMIVTEGLEPDWLYPIRWIP